MFLINNSTKFSNSMVKLISLGCSYYQLLAEITNKLPFNELIRKYRIIKRCIQKLPFNESHREDKIINILCIYF